MDSNEGGVSQYTLGQSRFFVINENAFSPKTLIRTMNSVRLSKEFYVVAPHMIQYFASEIRNEDEIFSAINILSKKSVVVDNAPTFRMTRSKKTGPGSDFMHDLSFASFPVPNSEYTVGYIGSEGSNIPSSSLSREFQHAGLNRVRRISLPLIFYLAGLDSEMLSSSKIYSVIDDKQEHGFDRLAYGELMIRFPSRELPNAGEITYLKNTLDVGDSVTEVWQHNRKQWDLVCKQKLSFINAQMPEPTDDRDKDEFYQFNHLLMSNFTWVAERLGLKIPSLKHVGIPLFARNGVTIPIGSDGIMTRFDESQFDDLRRQQISNRFSDLLKAEDFGFSAINVGQPLAVPA